MIYIRFYKNRNFTSKGPIIYFETINRKHYFIAFQKELS